MRARIYAVGDAWHGEAEILTAGMDAMQKTAIAIGGLLAEARAAAEKRAEVAGSADQNRRIATDARLIQEIGRVIGIGASHNLPSVPASVPISSAPGNSILESAALSHEDIDYIPDEVADDDKAIKAALAIALDVINNDGYWAEIRRLREKLIEAQPEFIGGLLVVLAGQ